jgi:ABC-type sugar transport system ATPase subunit
MDVAAKEDVMRLVTELKQHGAAVVLSSAEPELLLAYADRILVLSRGRVTQQLVGTDVDTGVLLRHANAIAPPRFGSV